MDVLEIVDPVGRIFPSELQLTADEGHDSAVVRESDHHCAFIGQILVVQRFELHLCYFHIRDGLSVFFLRENHQQILVRNLLRN